MKTITIDFDTYTAELTQARSNGYREAMHKARRIAEEFRANAHPDHLISEYCDEQIEVELVRALFEGQKK